jgi:RsiW-degrading membrane proteinase PrsW (M82 family)
MFQLPQIIGSILLALFPAVVWGFVFCKKAPENRTLTMLTFVVGALAVFPILLYKFMWQFFPWINAFEFAQRYQGDLLGFTNLAILPISVVITFMIVGLIEEVMKMISVKVADKEGDIQNIDDAIELFIIAALGFAFAENILYFYNIWLSQGASNLLLPFIFRSSFSTLAHIIFSGILGYYYGIAHFAKPILQEEIRKNRRHWTIWLHKILNIRKEKLFYQENIAEGLLISIGLHALFNILLELNLTFMIVPFLVGGYMTLNYLFKKKENHKNYGKVLAQKRNHS